MPQIPTRESDATFPVTGRPRMPMSNPALEAMGKLGSTAEAIGAKFAEQDIQRRREAQFTKVSTDAARDLFNLKMSTLNDPAFSTNPIETANAFGPKSQEIQAKYLEGIKDPDVQNAFNKQFAQEALRSMEHLAERAHTQSRHVDRGADLSSISDYENMAGMDPDMQDAVDSLNKAEGIYNRMESHGLIEPEKKQEAVRKMYGTWAHARITTIADKHPEEAQAILSNPRGISGYLTDEQRAHLGTYIDNRIDHIKTHSETEQAKAEERQLKAENDKAFLQVSGVLKDKDPGDPAWGDLRNHIQSDPASFGLSVHPSEQAMKISGDLETMQKQRRESAKEAVSSANDKLIGKVLGDKPPSVDEINAFQGADSKGREAAIRWINSDEAKRNHTDLELYGKLVSDIGARRINDPEELNQHLAEGLSKGDYHQLRGMIESERDPEKSPSLKYAKEAFFAKYSVGGQLPDDIVKLYPRFITQYEQQVRGQQLKGDKTHDLADKMLQDVDKQAISSWRGWRTGTALEYAKSWGAWPEPDLTPEPVAQPANLPQRDPLGIR